MTTDELLEDYYHRAARGHGGALCHARVIEAALHDRPDIASGAELIDWLMSADEP